MSDMTALSLDDLGRILDDEAQPAGEHIRAAREVFRRYEMIQVEEKLARLRKELVRRGLHLTLVPPSPRPDDASGA